MDQLELISKQIWDMKYRLKNSDGSVVDKTIQDTWLRVAKALAASADFLCHFEQLMTATTYSSTVLPPNGLARSALKWFVASEIVEPPKCSSLEH